MITEEVWWSEFRPVERDGDIHDGFSGVVFDTVGSDWFQVRSMNTHYVWTWVEHDDGSSIIPGIHFVNRLGYFITEVPWDDIMCEVVIEEF